MKTALTIALTFIVMLANAGGKTEGDAKRDTVQAVVLYGEELLFEVILGRTNEQVIILRDSIMECHGANELCNMINLYLSLKDKSEEDLYHYIDSVFEAGDVPYALINQINLFLANRPEAIEDIPNTTGIYCGSATGLYPAEEFYPVWDNTNPNPYPVDLGSTDTALSLMLCGTEVLGQFHIPVKNTITSKYGWRSGRMHKGIDIDLAVNDPVVAAFSGVVRVARVYGGYGRVVVVRHYNGLETLYAHLHRFKVKEGDVVQGGQLIGLGGSSGKSSGSHLHFEVRFRGCPLNPMSFISFEEDQLVNDTLMLRRINNGYVAYPKGTLIHAVKKGDTLHDIAKTYGTTTNRLAELNGIHRNSYLRVGQRLRVI